MKRVKNIKKSTKQCEYIGEPKVKKNVKKKSKKESDFTPKEKLRYRIINDFFKQTN